MRRTFQKIEFAEKRMEERLEVKLPARFRLLGPFHMKYQEAKVFRVSFTGLGLESDVLLPEGRHLKIRVQVPSGSIRLRGRVCWYQTKIFGQRYHAGIEVDGRSRDLEVWHKFLYAQIKP